jgi:outer membrane protein assembly factor BamE (lipoprotein component of BamABCDE complex)
MERRFRLWIYILIALLPLNGCSSFARSDVAAEARQRMVGMSKEEVLACMGPPKQKATVGMTEVWSYNSTNGLGTSGSLGRYDKTSGFSTGGGTHQHYFCTVNVVMKSDIVSVVHYNGPRGGMMNRDEQCGYAVEHCVEN